MAAAEITGIPTIDLIDFPRQSEKLLQACEDWGSFRLINHDVPLTLLSEVKSVVRSLFDRPDEIKRRNTAVIPGSGYLALKPDYPLYEALGLYDIVSDNALDNFCSQLDATPQERETMKLFAGKLHELGKDLGRKIAASVGLTSNLFDGWTCQFRINKYHFTEETVGSVGVITHTDSSFLTILLDDESVGGLEVLDKSGTFVAVDPLPGSLLVNLGDVAKVWSNGRMCNVKHRVMCKEAVTRFSVAMFVLGPKEEEAIEAPAELLKPDQPRVYHPFTYNEYRKLRIAHGHQAGEALSIYEVENAPSA
ncbi:hypothetical protein H6P81_004614 [Aristolochia fimbriata]|uniref:2-oxoglutarate-dependent dioxygenase DAO n=1 Tax=Aristolochia fimbriata TaxID=158543 RepID=A0AAV7ES63_ARIFI|nr:hypothetical protein H6P81_004614 [Aristolochia fimbriata]